MIKLKLPSQLIGLGLFVLGMAWLFLKPTEAAPYKQVFSQPTTLRVKMYALNTDGSKKKDKNENYIACTPGTTESERSTEYGCTFYPKIAELKEQTYAPYPFESENVTLNYQSDNRQATFISISIDENGEKKEVRETRTVELGYLYNVVPQELDPSHPVAAVKAQAIAARTFAYWHIQAGIAMNNSNDFQVYIPFRYDILSISHKNVIDQALIDAAYLSPNANSTDPIKSHFGADNCLYTSQGQVNNVDASYLRSIYDPISGYADSLYKTPDKSCENGDSDHGTGYGGMSASGASRWAFGHTSALGTSSPDENASFWSVRWDTAQQILAHYYTGINFIGLTPDPPDDYRFNMLDIHGLPADYTPDTVIQVNPGDRLSGLMVQLQNTGGAFWKLAAYLTNGDFSCPAGSTRFGYRVYRGETEVITQRFNLCYVGASYDVQPGNQLTTPQFAVDIPLGTPAGRYQLRLDMEFLKNGTWEWASGANLWPTQNIEICVLPCDSPNPTPTPTSPEPTATPEPTVEASLPTKDLDKSTSETGWRNESQLQLAWNTGYGIENAPTLHYSYDGPGATLQPQYQASLGQQTHQSGQAHFNTLFLQNPLDGDHYFCLYYDNFEHKLCYHYHVDRTPPQVAFTEPERDLSFSPHIDLAWQASDNLTHPPQVMLYRSPDPDHLWDTPVTVEAVANQTLELAPLATTELLTYYVGLKATDSAGNVSQISRVLHLYTGPLMNVSNRSLQGLVLINQHGQLQLGIDNLGSGTLYWEVALVTNPDAPVEEVTPGQVTLLNPVSGSTVAGERSWVTLEAWANQLGAITLPSLVVRDVSGRNCPITVNLGLHSASRVIPTYLPLILGGNPRLTVAGCLPDSVVPQTSLITSRSASALGWYNTPLQVTFAVTDNLSGVKQTRSRELPETSWQTAPVITLTTEGTHTLEYYSEDVLGNVEPVQTTTLPIDLTPPTVTVTLSNPPTYNRCETLPLEITDNPAGLVTTAFQVDGQPMSEPFSLQTVTLGQHTLSLTATDAAGWQSSRNVTFTLTTNLPCAISTLVPDPTMALSLTNLLTDVNALLDEIQLLTPEALTPLSATLLTQEAEAVGQSPCDGCNSRLTIRQNEPFQVIHPRYTIEGGQSFILSNGQARTFAPLAPGNYTVSQDPTTFPDEYWALLSVTCRDQTGQAVSVNWSFVTYSAQVTLNAHQQVTCTFLNERANVEPN